LDLILSEEPSTDAHGLQLEPADVEVDPLVDVQLEKVLSLLTLSFVFKLVFQYIFGLFLYICFHLCRLIHLIRPILCVLLMSVLLKRLSSRFGDR
jgi:hypothetical protein